MADAYGTTVENLIGKTDADFNPNPDEVAAFRQADLFVMDTQRETLIPEEKITDSSGRVRWLQTVKRPVIGDDGRAHQVLGVSTDLTETAARGDAALQGERGPLPDAGRERPRGDRRLRRRRAAASSRPTTTPSALGPTRARRCSQTDPVALSAAVQPDGRPSAEAIARRTSAGP